MQVGVGNKEDNIAATLRHIDTAAGHGARLIVLPELANTGYAFATRAEAYEHAESVPDGVTCQAWAKAAAAHDAYIVGGVAEIDGVTLYDTAVLIGPDGYIGRYRKTHLWNREKLIFTTGDDYPVFDTKNRPYRAPHLLGHLVPRGRPNTRRPGRRHHLFGQQLGMDATAALRRRRELHGVLSDYVGIARQQHSYRCRRSSRRGARREIPGMLVLITGTNGWPIGEIADAEATRSSVCRHRHRGVPVRAHLETHERSRTR